MQGVGLYGRVRKIVLGMSYTDINPAPQHPILVHLLTRHETGVLQHSYLAECVHQEYLESQLPHQIVNLLFNITYQNIKLTVLWGD